MAEGAYSDFALLGLAFSQDENLQRKGKIEESKQNVFSQLDHCSDQASVLCLHSNDSCICTQEDFIIFSEFSEVQGPLPILTIPSHIQDSNDLDINSFILKIMSIDYQTKNSGDQFTITEDVQLIHLSIMKKVHAYSHYFTLYDLQARGFVRQMCLAYVTRDDKKLTTNFPMLKENFLKMTEIVKLNNRQVFLKELNAAVHNLKREQEMYFQLKKNQEEENLDTQTTNLMPGSPGIQPLIQQYTEFQHLQHLIEKSLEKENEEIQQILNQWEMILYSSCQREVLQFIQILKQSTNIDSIRPVLAISPWGIVAALWGLWDILKNSAKCPLQVQLNDLWGIGIEKSEINQQDTSSLALKNSEFLNIIHCLTFPKEHNELKTTDLNLNSKPMDIVNNASGMERCCSFQSASEVPILGSSEESEVELYEETNDDDSSLWSTCLWSKIPHSPQSSGADLLKIFTGFSQAVQHLIYAMLSGRPLVVAGTAEHRDLVIAFVRALTPLIPPSSTMKISLPILRWHQGILVAAHLQKYLLIGLCVPEKLTVHELMSANDMNRVTILDIVRRRVYGPAYSGHLLASLEPSSCGPLLAAGADTLLLLLKATISEILSKVHIALALQSMSPPDIKGCDLIIIRHLIKTLPSL